MPSGARAEPAAPRPLARRPRGSSGSRIARGPAIGRADRAVEPCAARCSAPGRGGAAPAPTVKRSRGAGIERRRASSRPCSSSRRRCVSSLAQTASLGSATTSSPSGVSRAGQASRAIASPTASGQRRAIAATSARAPGRSRQRAAEQLAERAPRPSVRPLDAAARRARRSCARPAAASSSPWRRSWSRSSGRASRSGLEQPRAAIARRAREATSSSSSSGRSPRASAQRVGLGQQRARAAPCAARPASRTARTSRRLGEARCRRGAGRRRSARARCRGGGARRSASRSPSDVDRAVRPVGERAAPPGCRRAPRAARANGRLEQLDEPRPRVARARRRLVASCVVPGVEGALVARRPARMRRSRWLRCVQRAARSRGVARAGAASGARHARSKYARRVAGAPLTTAEAVGREDEDRRSASASASSDARRAPSTVTRFGWPGPEADGDLASARPSTTAPTSTRGQLLAVARRSAALVASCAATSRGSRSARPRAARLAGAVRARRSP